MIMIKNKKKPIILDNPVINMFRYNIGIVAVLLRSEERRVGKECT